MGWIKYKPLTKPQQPPQQTRRRSLEGWMEEQFEALSDAVAYNEKMLAKGYYSRILLSCMDRLFTQANRSGQKRKRNQEVQEVPKTRVGEARRRRSGARLNMSDHIFLENP